MQIILKPNQMRTVFLIFLFLCLNIGTVAQTPFTCNGQLYISLYEIGANTALNQVEISPNGTTANFSQIGTSMPFRINSIGYRVTDNLIYGVHVTNNRLYQIDATGTAVELDQINLTNNYNYVAGDVTPDGNDLVLVGRLQNNPSSELAFVDLTSPNYTTSFIPLIDAATGLPNSSVSVADIAFNPITGEIYAYASNLQKLITIDAATGEIDTARYQPTTANGIGALFFDALGQLWAYGRQVGNTQQQDLFSIDLTTGATTYIVTGPATNGNDGCSCPYIVDLGKTIGVASVPQCETFTITYPISNLSGTTQSGIDFVDTLPMGFTIEQIVNNPFGGTITGIGTNQLNIDNMTLPLGVDDLIVEVKAAADFTGAFSGHAHLDNLPTHLGTSILSDNPSTFQVDDATGTTVVAGTNCDCIVAAPNAFSPNNDGRNDYFFPKIEGACEFSSFQFSIFNRWGQLVYQTNSSTPSDLGWNGNLNGKEQPMDTYVWVMEYQNMDNNEPIIQKGSVLLVR